MKDSSSTRRRLAKCVDDYASEVFRSIRRKYGSSRGTRRTVLRPAKPKPPVANPHSPFGSGVAHNPPAPGSRDDDQSDLPLGQEPPKESDPLDDIW